MPATAEAKVKAKAKRKSSSSVSAKKEETAAARQRQKNGVRKVGEEKEAQFYQAGVQGVYNSYEAYKNQNAEKQGKKPSIKAKGSFKENVDSARKRNKGQLQVWH